MPEQSHKAEMRAALRGDFARLRARQGRAVEGIEPPRPAAAERPLPQPEQQPTVATKSRLRRFLGHN